MDDGYDNQEWGESSGMRGDSEMGDVSFTCFGFLYISSNTLL